MDAEKDRTIEMLRLLNAEYLVIFADKNNRIAELKKYHTGCLNVIADQDKQIAKLNQRIKELEDLLLDLGRAVKKELSDDNV